MKDHIECGTEERLIAYLYEECDAAERAAIAAHVATCAACEAELEALADTRRALAAWVPPETAIGFRLTGEEAQAASASRASATPRAAWWREPLPAWAQAAAAVLIFAAGALAGGAMSRDPAPVPSVAREAADWQPAVTALTERVDSIEATARDHGALLTELRTERPSAAALLQQVRGEIAQSERNLREDMAIGLLQLKREENRSQEQFLTDIDARLNNHARLVTQLISR